MASRDIYERSFDEDIEQNEQNMCPECSGRVTMTGHETVCDDCGLVFEDQEIDVIAYHPENTQILFIECTNQDISEKEQILDRTEAISSVLDDYLIPTDIGLIEPLETVPCVPTPQKPEELNDDIVSEFEEKGIELLHSERLRAIYAASQDTTETVDAKTQFMEVI